MKKIIIITAVIMTMVIIKAEGAFVDTYWGVRALGMGGAFTAVANDSNAPLYNIAGTANATQQEVTLMGSRLFTGLEGVEIGANYFGYIHPMREEYGTISFAWSSISTPGLRREDTFKCGICEIFKRRNDDRQRGSEHKRRSKHKVFDAGSEV
jgi:hypothetical protein